MLLPDADLGASSGSGWLINVVYLHIKCHSVISVFAVVFSLRLLIKSAKWQQSEEVLRRSLLCITSCEWTSLPFMFLIPLYTEHVQHMLKVPLIWSYAFLKKFLFHLLWWKNSTRLMTCTKKQSSTFIVKSKWVAHYAMWMLSIVLLSRWIIW